jgi:broad specificity phosphatase PhoE
MTTFHLVRHAEKIGTDVLAGRAPGVHLSEAGRAQAERLVTLFEREPLSRILSSPLERARETAAPLARDKGLSVDVVEAFHEMDLGAWTGRTPAELAGDPHWERYHRFRRGTRAPGGECVLEVQARFVGGLLRWRDELPDASIAVFSHAEPIRAALLFFSGASLEDWSRFEVGLASVSTLELSADDARLTRLNVTAS